MQETDEERSPICRMVQGALSPRGGRSAQRCRPAVPAWMVAGLLILGNSSAADAPPTVPTVAQLLTTCARGYANGNKGVDAAACEWFANPCGCKPGAAGRDHPRWCIPAAEPADATVRKVVDALRRHPDSAAPVDLVVPDILVRSYPCPSGVSE